MLGSFLSSFPPDVAVEVNGNPLPPEDFTVSDGVVNIPSLQMPEEGDLRIRVGEEEFVYKYPAAPAPEIPETGDAGSDLPLALFLLALVVLLSATIVVCSRKKQQ